MLDNEGGPVRDNDMITAALEYAATVLALRMMDRVASQRIEDKYRDVFLEDLLTNNVKTETEIHSRARLYGWDFHNGGLVVIVDINNIKKFYVTGFDLEKDSKLQEASRGIFDVSISQMLAVFPGAKCYKQSDLAVFIVSPEKYEQNKIYAQLEGVFDAIRSRIAGKMIFTVTMGVGEYFPNIRDIHKSYRQARTSINLGYQIEKFDCILFYSRMGIYRLLSSIAGTDEAREFIERYVRPLADYDAKYNASPHRNARGDNKMRLESENGERAAAGTLQLGKIPLLENLRAARGRPARPRRTPRRRHRAQAEHDERQQLAVKRSAKT